MSLQYLREPWEEIFDSYHNCSSTKAQTMIFHRFMMTMMISTSWSMMILFYIRNGCGPTPELCMYYPSEDSAYWAQNSPNTHRYEANVMMMTMIMMTMIMTTMMIYTIIWPINMRQLSLQCLSLSMLSLSKPTKQNYKQCLHLFIITILMTI